MRTVFWPIASRPEWLAVADTALFPERAVRPVEAGDIITVVLGSDQGSSPAGSSGQFATIGSNWWRILYVLRGVTKTCTCKG